MNSVTFDPKSYHSRSLGLDTKAIKPTLKQKTNEAMAYLGFQNKDISFLEKTTNAIADDIKGVFNGQDFSLTRGLLYRVLLGAGANVLFGNTKIIGNPNALKDFWLDARTKMAWELSYRLGEKIFVPLYKEMAGEYEKKDGKYRDRMGSAEHIYVKVKDNLIKTALDTFFGGAMMAGYYTAINKDTAGRTVDKIWYDNFLRWSRPHKGGIWLNEWFEVSGARVWGRYFLREMGLFGTFPGILLGTAAQALSLHRNRIGAERTSESNKNIPYSLEELSKIFAIRIAPTASSVNRWPRGSETSQPEEMSKKDQQKLLFAERMSSAIFALSSFGIGSAFAYFNIREYKKNKP